MSRVLHGVVDFLVKQGEARIRIEYDESLDESNVA